ncbi:hypothetical protein Q3G72_003265 [Acer saccharum]|nr:hypothetical protein Q3G72_003265 [Acer saccharum]
MQLWNLPIKKLIVEAGAMPCLRELEIRSCQHLGEVTGLQNVTTLKELVLTNIPNDFGAKVEKIFLEGGDAYIRYNTWSSSPPFMSCCLWSEDQSFYSYNSTDSIATFALGILSSNIIGIFDDDCGDNRARSLDPNIELTTFLAQFLLLHLGGADSITAYALEDNALWMRHLLGLVTQTCGIVYINP